MLFIFLFLFLFGSLLGDELTVDLPPVWNQGCLPCRPIEPCPPPFCDTDDNVVVDLIDPIYENGTLTTEKGGVLIAPDLRIQAQKITYVRKLDEENPIFTVACEGDLLIDYQNWVLVGDSIFYDFLTSEGRLLNGRTAAPPWYIGGREVLLQEDGELVILDGYVTTSEGDKADLSVFSPHIRITPERVIIAKNVTLRVNQIPVFWLPVLQFDLNNTVRSPFGARFGWGGFLGSYVSLLYQFLSWNDFEATARLDAFIPKGLGFGIETAYDPSCRPTQFYTRNYYAWDIRLDSRKRKDRYRLEGTYYDRIYDITIDGIYDFVSDAQMAADYNTRDFDLKTAGRTQLELRKQTDSWIANLFTRVRVNHFQSVNQELPSFRMHLHPFEIPSTGVIVQNTLKVGYLDYVFSDDVVDSAGTRPHDFSAGRFSVHPFLYRPFFLGPVTITPEAGLIGIAYSNSPSDHSVGQALGEFGVKVESALTKCAANWKHVIEPYTHYTVLTAPRVNTDNHFIFTIDDGWDRLNLFRFGVRNSVFWKVPCGVSRGFWIDLWANAFINTETIPSTIPRGYLDLEWMPTPRLFIGMDSAWHFQERELDFINGRIDWTISETLAIGFEGRYRSKFDWRKADFYNFILESVRSQEALLESPLSDQRYTFLFRTFYRLNTEWTIKFDLRTGRHLRFKNMVADTDVDKKQPPYFESSFEISRLIFKHWRMTFIYEKREAGPRYSFSLLMEPGPPPRRKACW